MKKRMWIRKRLFTLVEVIVSMAVFALLMLGLMQFFSSAQGLWTTTGNQVSTYEEARTAMNMMAADLMCAYYEEGRTVGGTADHRYFFIVQDPDVTFEPALNPHRFKGFAFATLRSARAHQNAITRLTEVFYRKRGNHLEMLELADNIQDIARENPALNWKWVTDQQVSVFENVNAAPFPFYRLLENVESDNNNDSYLTPPSSPANQPAWSVIANNVVRFSVKVFQNGGGVMGFSTAANASRTDSRMFHSSGTNVTKIPDMVVMRLLMIDPQSAREIKILDPDCIYEEHLETARNGFDCDDVLPDIDPAGSADDRARNRIRQLLRKNMVIITRAVTLNQAF